MISSPIKFNYQIKGAPCFFSTARLLSFIFLKIYIRKNPADTGYIRRKVPPSGDTRPSS
jgi:hypothetical protein